MVPSELLENLHVSVSEESNAAADPTSIAISTARIFRGIVVDRNGVITSMNPRAMRSQKGKGEAKNKMGEKSRQAAKIDKAKDLIDEVAENGGVGTNMSEVSRVLICSDIEMNFRNMQKHSFLRASTFCLLQSLTLSCHTAIYFFYRNTQDENDPTKIVSLFVMGEYEDLNDLVRDGSKKLRDSKTLTDEDILRYNRPRIFTLQPMAGGHQMSNVASGMLSPNSSHYNSANILSPYGPESAASPTSQSVVSNIRKRVFSSDKPRAIYHKVIGSTPKIKSSPRDTRAGGSNGRGGRMGASPGSVNSGYHSQHSEAFGCNPLGSPLAACDANKQQHPQQQAYPNYFQQQCNFFPGNADWTEVLGFSVNSLWNCGANGDLTPTMSPHSNPSSPRGGAGSPLLHQQQHGAHAQGGHHHGNNTPTTTGGAVYHGSGATTPTGPGYHGSSATGYGGATTGYHHQYNNNNGGFSNYNATSPYRDEGRNPSYGYGRGSGAGVRDTVVM
jgi:hypothetical protein